MEDGKRRVIGIVIDPNTRDIRWVDFIRSERQINAWCEMLSFSREGFRYSGTYEGHVNELKVMVF